MAWLSLVPFAAVLLTVAIAPQLAPHTWERPLPRALLLAAMATPALVLTEARAHLGHVLEDYCAFMALLCALFTVAGGIVIEGFLGGTPRRNTALLAVGTALASLMGTTGAAMLLVRPWLRANVHRQYQAHQVVFFIVLIGNVGGLLLPMGDPPLFMGYLRGVPFFWTLKLWPAWLCASALLLALFFVLDSWYAAREPLPPIAAAGLGVRGRHNVALLVLMVLGLLISAKLGVPPVGQALGLALLALVSWRTTSAEIHRINQLTLAPLLEVAMVFAAIFLTLPPATQVLMAEIERIGAVGPEGLFWLTGITSSILDNAPCYLAMAAMAQASLHVGGQSLAELVALPEGAKLLVAISEGAVMMGAMTYIGNGPNLLVRSLAEQRGVKTPSFVGYLTWTTVVLLPVVAATRWLTG